MHFTLHPTLLWFFPFALLAGIHGTWTARSARGMAGPHKGRASKGLLLLAWAPMLIWITQQFHE